MKIILYIATSSDGFIADSKGGVDWLPQPENDQFDIFGYSKLLKSISTIIMGNTSYQQILSFGDWQWKDKKTYVFTNKDLTSVHKNVHFTREMPKSFIANFAKKYPNENIWLLGGAKLIHSFAIESLIDECIITVIPKKLGSGIKLELPFEEFTLHLTKECPMDIMQNYYIKKEIL